jgi:hypothetical protein
MRRFLNNGTTLLEILIALFIMATAMIPIASIMGYGGRATSKDARRIVAIQLLDKTLRQLLQQSFDDIPVAKNVQTGFNGIRLGDVVAENGETYNLRLNSEFVNPARFAYQGVDVNRPKFNGSNPVAADFTAQENLVLNDVILRLELLVQWNEQKDLPVSVSAVTFRADFNRRSG